MIVLSLYLSKGLEIDPYLYHCERRESVLRYPSIVTDYAYSVVIRWVAQATVHAA
jgi:hypothetical protein